MFDRASVFYDRALAVESAAGDHFSGRVDFAAKHLAKAMGVCAEAHGDGLVFNALQAHQPNGDRFFEVERDAFNRYRIEFYAREGVDKSSHGSFLLMVKSAAGSDRALTDGPGVSQAPGPHHSASGFVYGNRNCGFLPFKVLERCCAAALTLWRCIKIICATHAPSNHTFDENQSASRAGSTCGARNLPLSAGADGGLYSGHGAFPPARHGSAYRGAVQARKSGPRTSPLLGLRSAFAGRSCGVAA